MTLICSRVEVITRKHHQIPDLSLIIDYIEFWGHNTELPTIKYCVPRIKSNSGVNISDASIVIMNLTLQFIRPLYRTKLINDIYNGLNEQGCLIIFEKVLGENSLFNRLFIKYYYEMKKRNGYSELEVSQKREALENVLIPYKLNENRALIMQSGFKYFDIFFKWYNFSGMLAIK